MPPQSGATPKDRELNLLGEVAAAEGRIQGLVRETPLQFSSRLSELVDAEVLLKLENLQLTGSFKLRGALNRLRSIPPDELRGGVVTASSGNHGAAVAYGAAQCLAQCTVFVPRGASEVKVRAIRGHGSEVRFEGSDAAETEAIAGEFARESGATYVSPYNDPRVIGGQGTVAAEVSRQAGRVDVVFAPVGGGGLISGVGGYMKEVYPECRVVGCSPQSSAVMARSVAAGELLDLASGPTLSDGTAGGVEPGAITFDLCRRYVDDFVLVGEGEIAAMLGDFIGTHGMLIEGAAAMTLAALVRERERLSGERVVVVVCGANISPKTLKEVL